jgi:hypothetical protein
MKRLKDFDDYLLDIILENKVNDEAAIILSKRLYDLLDKISNDISIRLMGFNHKSVKSDKVTMIDYDEKELDKFTYIVPLKLREYINKEMSSENITDELSNKYDLINLTNDFPELWKIKSRTSIKIGKLINKLFPNEYDPEKEIELFVDSVKIERKKILSVFKRFKIVTEKDIQKYYNYENYDTRAFGGSSLGNSCMRYKQCENFIEFYAYNPGVSLVILMSDDETQDDRIMGRALLWDIAEIDGIEVKRKFLDRIYTIYKTDIHFYKEYAKRNGWLYKNEQSMSSTEDIVDPLDGTNKRRSFKTTSTAKMTDEFPYMDTMKYFYYDENFLANTDKYGSECYFLEDTNGEFEDMTGIYVEYYARSYPEDDLTWCELGGEYRLNNEAIYIEQYGESATQEYIDQNMVYSEYEENYIDNYDSVYSNYHEDYLSSENAIEVYKSGTAYVESVDELEDSETDARSDNEINDSCFEYSWTDDENTTHDVYFDNDDKKYFVKAESLITGDNQYLHKIWDKGKFFKYKGKIYINDDQAKKDKMLGQKRIWDE